MGDSDSVIFDSSVSPGLAPGLLFPAPLKEGVHLSQEGQSQAFATVTGLSLGHQPPPLCSLPLATGLAQCFL